MRGICTAPAECPNTIRPGSYSQNEAVGSESDLSYLQLVIIHLLELELLLLLLGQDDALLHSGLDLFPVLRVTNSGGLQWSWR